MKVFCVCFINRAEWQLAASPDVLMGFVDYQRRSVV